MKKNTIAILVIAAIVLAAACYQVFLRKEKPDFTLADVVRGNIVQEVSETGQIQKGDKINLGFKSAGRIERIFIEKSKNVEPGEILAKLDGAQLQVQLQEAKSARASAQAKLDKLLAGASQEEIKVKQTEVSNKQTALGQANQDLDDVYDDALVALDDVYLKAYNSYNTVDLIQRAYFTISDQEGLNVSDDKRRTATAVSKIKSNLDDAKLTPTNEKIDSVLSGARNELSNMADYLKNIRETCETPLYRTVVSSSDKSSLDTQRINIATAITNTVNSQQAISSAKLDVTAAEGKLQSANDDLNLLLAPARQEDIDLYEAQLAEAEAKVQMLETQIQDVYLRSPAKGQITDIKKRTGEIAQSQDIVFVLLPAVPFDIKVDVYEEDVVKVNVGNPVDISLVAFPNQVFRGRVAAINPAEEIVEGVVYYEVVVVFEEMPEGIKPGMTADVVIQTSSKENVLIVPGEAVEEKDGKTIVQVLENKSPKEKEIKTGLLGNNGNVEVISGLEEGAKVVIFK